MKRRDFIASAALGAAALGGGTVIAAEDKKTKKSLAIVAGRSRRDKNGYHFRMDRMVIGCKSMSNIYVHDAGGEGFTGREISRRGAAAIDTMGEPETYEVCVSPENTGYGIQVGLSAILREKICNDIIAINALAQDMVAQGRMNEAEAAALKSRNSELQDFLWTLKEKSIHGETVSSRRAFVN